MSLTSWGRVSWAPCRPSLTLTMRLLPTLYVAVTERKLTLYHGFSPEYQVHHQPPRLDPVRLAGWMDPDWPTLLALATDLAGAATDEDGIDVSIVFDIFPGSNPCWQMLLNQGLRIRTLRLSVNGLAGRFHPRDAPTTLLPSTRPCQPKHVALSGGMHVTVEVWAFLHHSGVLTNPRTSSFEIDVPMVAPPSDGWKLPSLTSVTLRLCAGGAVADATTLTLVNAVQLQLVRPLVRLSFVSSAGSGAAANHRFALGAPLLTSRLHLTLVGVRVSSDVRVASLRLNAQSVDTDLTSTGLTSLRCSRWSLSSGVTEQEAIDTAAAHHALTHVHMSDRAADAVLPASVLAVDVLMDSLDGVAPAFSVARRGWSRSLLAYTIHFPKRPLSRHSSRFESGAVVRYFCGTVARQPWGRMRLLLSCVDEVAEAACRRRVAALAFGTQVLGLDIPGQVVRVILMRAFQALAATRS